ncbi:MAG: trimethylamine methyltransferase family protein [Spirochaetales bacterium]|nr:trimethylamine methyltransferase family protein [Spirochaetales bacterium]
MTTSHQGNTTGSDIRARPRLQFLSAEQAECIHRASLRLLETAGVKVHLPEAVDLLKKAGAEVVELPEQSVFHPVSPTCIAIDA